MLFGKTFTSRTWSIPSKNETKNVVGLVRALFGILLFWIVGKMNLQMVTNDHVPPCSMRSTSLTPLVSTSLERSWSATPRPTPSEFATTCYICTTTAQILKLLFKVFKFSWGLKVTGTAIAMMASPTARTRWTAPNYLHYVGEMHSPSCGTGRMLHPRPRHTDLQGII